MWGKRNKDVINDAKLLHYKTLYKQYKEELTRTKNELFQLRQNYDTNKRRLKDAQACNITLNKEITLLKNQNAELESLRNVPKNSTAKLTRDQELLFREMLEFKQKNSEDDVIEAHNIRGPSKKLLILQVSNILKFS